ncbi:MAG: aldehyde dehydrogenase family protein, partial [Ardenticatenales bacterium]
MDAPALSTLDYAPAPESDAQARAWIAARGPDFGLFVDGLWRASSTGESFDTHFPATGEVLARIAQAGAADVDVAVAAARAAQPAWAALGGHGRARFLYAIARHVQKHHRLLAVLETLDNGKPIRETRDIDVPLVARHFYHHAGWAQLFEERFAQAGYGPYGVCGQIIPWNFPLLMLSWKIAPALAAGNTVVLKPAEFTSLTALRFAEICQDVGLPPGVVNIVTGDGRTGEAIVAHRGVDKIAFTGSTDVGRILRRSTAGTGKGLTLELGGKSPFVVFADADVDSAVEGVVDAIWFNQGQVCCAGSRLLVQESIAQDFYRRLRARMERLRVGSPLDKAVDIGAIIAPVQLDRIRVLCAAGVAEGAVCHQPSWAMPADGWFYPPTLFTNVEPTSTIAQVEIFGPVLVAMTFRTPDEAVALANNTPYGLAASVWSENVNVALDVAHRIKAGTVWVNGTNQFDASSGFGGYRESGFGREGGVEGMWGYVRLAGPHPPTPSPKSGGGGGREAEGGGVGDPGPAASATASAPRPQPVILPLPQTWGRGSGG